MLDVYVEDRWKRVCGHAGTRKPVMHVCVNMHDRPGQGCAQQVSLSWLPALLRWCCWALMLLALLAMQLALYNC